MRALAGVVAVSLDAARLHPNAQERERHQARADLMIPVIKGWCTENSVDIASIGIQVHGGVGFIEETGAAQYLRDARITPIYEGTTAIQANDLIGRKLARDGGEAAQTVVAEMRALASALSAEPKLSSLAPAFSAAVDALERAIAYVVENYGTDIRAVSVGAVPMLKLFGIVAGGWQLLRSASIAQRRLAGANGGDAAFYEAKILTARFYADYVLSQSSGLAHSIVHGAAGALAEDAL
jgi:acyl-CoA dehydrogenase